MSRFDEYENRLHKIIVHSADVLPDQVKSYLKELAKSTNDDIKKNLLSQIQDFKPLVDAIPKEFVDFALDILIKKPINLEDLPSYPRRRSIPPSDDRWNRYSINNSFSFFPPAPIQGPFFYVLLNNEDEGLRLVHSLTNIATNKWCEYQKREEFDRPGLTPLPVTINFPFGSQHFWGNTQIYCWFRDTTVGPYAVISALMALEEWMERQIESDRDVEPLFHKVLAESHSVAVLGICVSLAIAYPEKCLKAILPIVSSPYVWEMDLARLVQDSSNSWKILKEWEWDSSKKLYYDVIERRNKRPQRSGEIRQLAMYYVLSDDDSLRIPFENAVAQFTENLPFWYQEEAEDPNAVAPLLDKMENYQVFGKRENYRQQKNGGYRKIWVERPQEIKQRNEKLLASNSEWERWLGIYLWAEQTIKDGIPQERMTLEEAVVAAKELQTSEDFIGIDKEDTRSITRLQAIAGGAAAILVADFEWAKAQNYVEWSRMVLLAAARMTETSEYAMSPSSVKVYAGRGLALLATHGVADLEVRQQILQLISGSLRHLSHANEVVKAIFWGLQNAWATDPVLFWNALSLCLSLSIIPGKIYYGTRVVKFGTSYEELETWEENVIQKHLDYLAKNEVPDLPRVPTARNIVFVHEQAKYGLCALLLTELCQDSNIKDNLLQLCDDLIARTIVDNLPVEGRQHSQPDRPYMWNPFIFNWAAYLAKSLSLEEIRHHILTPLRGNWAKVPDLTADLLDGYISHQIAYVEGPSEQALEIWKEICCWVLDSPEISRKVSHDYLDNETGEILQLIIFTQHGSSRIKDDWQHAHLFVDVFDKWVDVVGHNPYAYSHLLTMLSGIGWQFSPEPTLKWLNQCASNATHDLWDEERGNDRRTAELLNRIWNSFETQIWRNTEGLQRYSGLVYRLVGAGVPLASVLQKKLEGRG